MVALTLTLTLTLILVLCVGFFALSIFRAAAEMDDAFDELDRELDERELAERKRGVTKR